MADLLLRGQYQAALMERADVGPQSVPSAELDMGMSPSVHNAELAMHDRLIACGAEDVFFGRLSTQQKRLWGGNRTPSIMYGAQIMPTAPNNPTAISGERVGLYATRLTIAYNLAKEGLIFAVAHRVGGNRHDVIPMGVSSDFAFVANSVASWREQVMAENANAHWSTRVRPSTR